MKSNNSKTALLTAPGLQMWEPFSTHMWGRGPIALRPLTSFLLYILLFSIALLFRAWASKYVGGGLFSQIVF